MSSSTPLDRYGSLGALVSYPRAGFEDGMRQARDLAAEHYPAASAHFEQFWQLLPKGDLLALQELYTRTFDVQAVTTLDIGYVLFGEDYKRGELLANLNREHRLAGNDCGTELPDFLPNLLNLLPKLADRALAQELMQEIIGPAMRKMIDSFDAGHLAQSDAQYEKHHKTLIETSVESRTVYRLALMGIYEIFTTDFELTKEPLLTQTVDFLQSLGNEMRIQGEMERTIPASS